MAEINQASPQSLYDLLGGEPGATEKIREIVEAFYDVMDQDPKAKTIRDMHAKDLTSAREKLFMFLCGWLGGPSYYTDQFGHPRLRMRHMPFAIGIRERDQWLACMHQAMQESHLDAVLVERLDQAFFQTADWMRNK